MSGDRHSFFAERVREIRGEGTTVPFEYEELKRAAADVLPDRAFEHLTASAGSGTTLAANRGFDAWKIVPRVFRNVTDCSLETSLFDRRVPSPVMLAPIGRQKIYHPEGERATARAARSVGVPFALSTVASTSIEDVASEMGDAPRLFQLYWTEDWSITASLLDRAEGNGYAGILLTVDFQARRWIPDDFLDEDAPQFGAPNANFVSDRSSDHSAGPVGDPAWDKTITWTDLSFLREHTDLPIYVKGIVHPEDAALAVNHGADGVVVSNHGARQADGSIGTIEALPEIVEVVDGAFPILFDGGIRRGADIFKALALGADGVFVGRPYVLGLSVAGAEGVSETVKNLLAEFESVAGMAGCSAVQDIDREKIRKASRVP